MLAFFCTKAGSLSLHSHQNQQFSALYNLKKIWLMDKYFLQKVYDFQFWSLVTRFVRHASNHTNCIRESFFCRK